MSIYIMLLIMLFAGLLGGTVNYIMPGNNPERGKYLSPWINCAVLGIAATLLVPLFLELTSSRIIEEVNYSWADTKAKDSSDYKTTSDVRPSIPLPDTETNSPVRADHRDTIKPSKPQVASPKPPTDSSGKNYLLWAAYCLVAAAAGFKFINMVINNVVKGDIITEQKGTINKLEKVNEKFVKNSQISQQQEETKIREEHLKSEIHKLTATPGQSTIAEVSNISTLPVLPPITNLYDPQKGRFGGKSEVNQRKLSATVTDSNVPDFYNVTLMVNSTDAKNPLNADVIFFIHDSFSPSVYTIGPDEFVEGAAIDPEILSYGAFTVGVITDNGKTMLELDLAEDKSFPKKFRER